MILPGGAVRVYVATRPVDFRKGHDGLCAVVQEALGLDPFCGAIFVFRSRRADRIKVLVWDQTGLVLAHKRLEGGTFAWPNIADGVMRLTPAQFSALCVRGARLATGARRAPHTAPLGGLTATE